MQLKQFSKCFICHLPFIEYLLIKVSFFTCRFVLIDWNYESSRVLQEPHEDKYRFNQITSSLAIKMQKVNYFQLAPSCLTEPGQFREAVLFKKCRKPYTVQFFCYSVSYTIPKLLQFSKGILSTSYFMFRGAYAMLF